MPRPPPRSTPFPTRRSSDLEIVGESGRCDLRPGDDEPDVARTCRLCHLEGLRLMGAGEREWIEQRDRKSTRLNSSHVEISYAVSCLKKKKQNEHNNAIK